MTFNFDDYKPLIAQIEKIGLPILTPIVTAAASGVAGPFGLAAPMILDGLVAAINAALGIPTGAPPQVAADAIAADPDVAKAKLASVQEDHSYLLAATKQSDDTKLASQAQQTALLALDAASQDRIQRLWRPAIGWGLGALLMIHWTMPDLIWFIKQVTGTVLDAFPALSDQALYIFGSLLGITVAARSADKATTASAVKAISRKS